MKRKTILVSLCVLYFLATNAFSGEALGPDKIKGILLSEKWISEWRGYAYEGTVEVIFEEREDKVVAIIHNELALDKGCERPVTITSEGFKMDGCNDTNITLVFDANDKEYPFKGESKEYYYKFKVK